jgi:hypothetical protein
VPAWASSPRAAARHIEAAWPVDPRTTAFDTDCAHPIAVAPGLDEAGFARLFGTLDELTWFEDYDRVIGVVPDGWFARQGVEGFRQAGGQAPFGSGLASGLVDARARGGWVTAHEIAHGLGWVSSDAGVDGHLDRVPARGFWVDRGTRSRPGPSTR